MAQRASVREGGGNGPYLGGRFLFVPSVKRGNGTGHLRRCVDLCGTLDNSCIYLPPEADETERGPAELKEILEELPNQTIIRTMPPPGRFECIVFDARRTGEELFGEAVYSAPVAGIDEGGTMRSRFDYLIDILPKPYSGSPPNIYSPAFLELPDIESRGRSVLVDTDRSSVPGASGTKNRSAPFRSVLVSFGGEDPAGLTEKTVRFLVEKGFFRPEQITAVRGPVAPEFLLPEGVQVLDRPKKLAPFLSGYDLVITAFGLTAYEAAASGAAVICVHPGRYHARLGTIAGFPFGGTGKPRAGRFRKALGEPEVLRLRSRAAVSFRTGPGVETGGLTGFLGSLVFQGTPVCPVCRERKNPAYMRFPDRTIFRCSSCRLFYQTLFTGEEKSYGTEYFFSEYKSRYGRTYLEDFDHIKEIARPRLQMIWRFLGRRHKNNSFRGCRLDAQTQPRLLDVGCAYGPFLAAAADAGYRAFGIDPAEPAVRYVQEELGIPALTARFDQISPSALPVEFPRKYDALAMWFVLEHFRDCGEALRKVGALLEQGGVFAFSTPNAGGISARRNPEIFFGVNPADHFTLWTRRSVRKILPMYGFTVKRIKITGHHPERFRALRKRAEDGRHRGAKKKQPSGFLYTVLLFVSRICRLGDTFEVYAVRKRRERPSA